MTEKSVTLSKWEVIVDLDYLDSIKKVNAELLEACKDALEHLNGECDHDNSEECDAVVRKILQREVEKCTNSI